jgi:thiol-disulfide isomerase/thioredoxin
MKKICTLLVALLALTSSQAQKKKKASGNIETQTRVSNLIKTTINGEILGDCGAWIVFAPFIDQSKQDTVKIVNNKFVYKTEFDGPTAFIYLRADGQSAVIFFDNTEHNVIIDCKDNKGFGLTNCLTQESYNKFISTITPLGENRQKYPTVDTGFVNSNERAIQNVFTNFIADTATKPIAAAFLVYNNIMSMQNAPEQDMINFYNQLPERARDNVYAKKALQYIQRMTADEMGKIAPDFTLLDINGRPVTLSSFRGKNYVLVDFWATWCGPCRAEFPALKAAQTQYASKGLVILGVSIDADKEKWKTMLAKPDFTNWTHVWDGPSGPNQVVQTLYNVPSIPRNFLLDKSGKVIARNLRGADVEQKLKELIK